MNIDEEVKEMAKIEKFLLNYTTCTTDLINCCYSIWGYNLETIQFILFYFIGSDHLEGELENE